MHGNSNIKLLSKHVAKYLKKKKYTIIVSHIPNATHNLQLEHKFKKKKTL